MTDAYSGVEPVTAPGVHDMPRDETRAQLTNRQMKRFATAFVDQILATIFYALSGIRIFGVKPFSFLRSWADDLVQRANDAYNGAIDAQETADTALQLLGVAEGDLVDSFERDDSSDLGEDWDQDYTGGSGSLGVKNGSAHWNESGAGTRRCNAVHVTPLSSDDGKVRFVVAGNLANVNSSPWIGLIARCNDDLDTYLLARINRSTVEIGYYIDGDYTQLDSAPHTTQKGVWEFEFGVDDFALSHNGVLRLTAIDAMSASQRGSDYRRAGFVMRAGNGLNQFFLFEQRRPPDIQAWAAMAA